MALPAGTTLGPYEILAHIGAGGMGEVYRARDTRLHRQVAIKVLPRDRIADPERQRRFLQEARAASALNHPNIVTVHDIASDAGVDYLVMECVPGRSLDELISPKGLPLREAINFATQIASALAAAHSAGIVHRDIKPSNVMVTPESQVKILDFGLAKLAEPASGPEGETLTQESALTQAGTLMGTAAYMSPEQASARPLDHRTDIFSVGVVLYEMLAGKRPFQGKSRVDTMHSIIHDSAPPLGGQPPELEEILAKTLAKDPNDRYQHVGDLGLDLRRFQRAWENKSLPSLHTAPYPAPRRRIGWGIFAALAVVALPIAWWLSRGRESDWRNPLEGATFTRLTDFEGVETDAVISPDGNFVAFISDRAGPLDVWVLQLGSGQFLNLTNGKVNIFSSQVRVLGFSPDGSQVTILTLPNPKGVRTGGTLIMSTIGGPVRTLLEGAFDPQWSPDGSRLLFFKLVQNKDVMYVADRDGANSRQVFQAAAGEHNHYMAWSLDGRYVYSARSTRNVQESDIWRAPAAGGHPESVTQHRTWAAYPAQLDERTLLFIASDENNSGTWLYAQDLQRREEHRLSVGIEQYSSIAVSPPVPGRRRRLVATVSNPVGSLWSVPIGDFLAAESSASVFPLPSAGVSSPSFGPDYLAYLSSRELADGLWKFQRGAATELWKTSNGAVLAPPAASRDGRLIAIAALRQGRAQLYVMTADGANPQPVAPSLNARDSPSWSPDSNRLAVTAYDDKGPGLFIVPIDGGEPVRLYDKLCYLPVWSPVGRYILFAEYVQGPTMQLRAITPDGKPVSLPEIRITRPGVRSMSAAYRFLPDGKSVVLLDGDWRRPQFWMVNLETGARRQLTDLRPGRATRSFDLTTDGKRILFDRMQENSDIVLIDLQQRQR